MFEATHATLLRLYQEGLIDGVRVDHVDGLADPPAYCRRLRARLEELAGQRPADAPQGPAWLVVEKILGAGERLPDDWAVDGTSGYDFMDEVSALLHDGSGEAALRALWGEVSGRPTDFAEEETAARRDVLEHTFTSQLDAAVDGAASDRHRARRHPRYHAGRDPPRAGGAAGAFPGVSQLWRRAAVRCALRQRWRVRWRMCLPAIVRRSRCLNAGWEKRRRRRCCRAVPAAECAARGKGGRGYRVTIGMACCCRATRSAPMCGASARRRRSSTRRASRGAGNFPTRCWRPRRTTTNAARTCARGSRCSARSRMNGDAWCGAGLS